MTRADYMQTRSVDAKGDGDSESFPTSSFVTASHVPSVCGRMRRWVPLISRAILQTRTCFLG